MTIRFMQRAKGWLPPARLERNAVIDFDGICCAPSLAAYKDIVAAHDAAGIPFGRHWAKTNNLGAARVRADYGAALDHWLAGQAEIMPDPADRHVFRNLELAQLGLIA